MVETVFFFFPIAFTSSYWNQLFALLRSKGRAKKGNDKKVANIIELFDLSHFENPSIWRFLFDEIVEVTEVIPKLAYLF